jgi:hypothetical protein
MLAASAANVPSPTTTISVDIARPPTVLGSGVVCPAVIKVATAQA